jgi:hypothetical protein
MVDPLNDTQYTCEILDGGKEPIVSRTNNQWLSANMRQLQNLSTQSQFPLLVSIASG